MHCYVPKRYVFCLLAFMGMFIAYAMRVSFSIAMVVMVKSNTDVFKNRTLFQECSILTSEEDWIQEQEYKGKRYDWDTKTQGFILGSFFYGYVFTQLPGGYLADKSSAKWVFASSVAVPSILFLFTPFAADLGVPVLLTIQVLQGLIQGALFPSVTVLISHWSPLVERSRISTFVFTGTQIGTVVALPVSGYLCSSNFFGGWPSAFYFFGVMGLIWFFFWSIFVYESPAVHPNISAKEEILFKHNSKEIRQNNNSTPWKEIFTSYPVWAFIIGTVGDQFGFLIFLTELPNYMHSVLHYSIQVDGSLSALPYIAQVVSAWLVSYLADRLRESKRLNITNIRKIMSLIGMIGPAGCLMCVTFFGCQQAVIVSLLVLAMALNGFLFSGVHVVPVDMCPDFSGTVFGLGNGIAYIFAASGPVLVGFLTQSGATVQNWNKAFYITSAIYVLTAVFFGIFASAEEQVWIKEENSVIPVIKKTETDTPEKRD